MAAIYCVLVISALARTCLGIAPDYLLRSHDLNKDKVDESPSTVGNNVDTEGRNLHGMGSVAYTGTEGKGQGVVGSNMTDVDMMEPTSHTMSLLVTTQDPCQSLCTCDMSSRQVDCSSRGLNVIPLSLPSDTLYLDLSANNISSIDDNSLEGLTQLQQLDLSYNHLQHVSASVFSQVSSLQSLYLQHNLLDEGFFLCTDIFEIVMTNDTYTNLTSVGLCNMTIQLLDLSNNQLSTLPAGLLEAYPQLEVLLLDYNSLTELPQLTRVSHSLTHLSITHNTLRTIDCASVANLSNLHQLNLGYNKLQQVPETMCSQYLEGLTVLTLSGNPFNALSPRAFNSLTKLTMLYLSDLDGLRYLPQAAFTGLPHLEKLVLSDNANLAYIHAEAFTGLESMAVLDLSNCGLSWLHESVFTNLSSLQDVRLSGNSWSCDCHLQWLMLWLRDHSHQHAIFCMEPPYLYGHNLLNARVTLDLACHDPVLVDTNVTQAFRIGQPGVIDCLLAGNAKTRVVWKVARTGQLLEYQPGYHDFYGSDPSRPGYHDSHHWHQDTSYYPTLEYSDRIKVLYNGSLYIDYMTRTDTGGYVCNTYYKDGNQTAVIHVLIDTQIQWFKVWSIIIGFICAFIFFFIAMVITSIYNCAVRCSAKERKRRKSIREVLNSLYDFKTVQIDRLCAYKTAKLNKLSVYKNAKIHKLVAFKTAKVGKLRNYKQVTVASIFHHLEKMREHYNSQMNRVKDNCSQQMEKLRDNYTNQVDKVKDYKQEKLDKVRDNYHCQIMKIRDYRSSQMDRLRDQYKLQQQHLLKLMELLDIGNCLNVVEAECMRTESMIFNPNISFDLEAEPVHVHRRQDLSDDESEYMTAGSQSDLSISENTFTDHPLHSPLDDQPYRSHKCRHSHQHAAYDDMSESDDSLSKPGDCDLDTMPGPPPPPNFHCDIPELDDQPLEQLVSDAEEAAEFFAEMDEEESDYDLGLGATYMDLDEVSMYQTPPSSAHTNMTSAIAENLPPDTSDEPTSVSSDHQPHYKDSRPKHSEHRVQSPHKKETIV